MSWIKVTRILDRDAAIDGLTCLRRDWQEAAEGRPLAEVHGNIGLMLADVVHAIGLLPEEAAQILGSETCVEPEQISFLVLAR